MNLNTVRGLFTSNPTADPTGSPLAECVPVSVTEGKHLIGLNNSLITRHIGRKFLPVGPLLSSSITTLNFDGSFSQHVSVIADQIFQQKIMGKKGKGKSESEEFTMAYFHNCLHNSDDRKWNEANTSILNMQRTNKMGTAHFLYEQGGYDFIVTSLVTILWQFGRMGCHQPHRLSEETEQHMLNVLLNYDDTQGTVGAFKYGDIDRVLGRILRMEQGSFDIKCPHSAGCIEESENHTWMILSSLYLICEYKMKDPEFNAASIVVTVDGDQFNTQDIKANLEARILAFITYTRNAGFYEFNSRPYVAFTLHALLNLEAFSSGVIKAEVNALLDHLNDCYAVSSYNYHRFPPFCRNTRKAGDTSLSACHHSTYFKSWTDPQALLNDKYLGTDGRFQRSTIATSLPYRPKKEVVDLMMDKTTKPYLARIGHGEHATAEIYYGGNGVLLSAGGVKVDGDRGEVTCRPITIIMDNGVEELQGLHRLGDIGARGNQTGVYENFACSRGKYAGPNGVIALANSERMAATLSLLKADERLQYGKWKVFELNSNALLAVYTTNENKNFFDSVSEVYTGSKDLGIFAIFNKQEVMSAQENMCVEKTPIAEQLILDIIKQNKGDIHLQRQFTFPYSHTKLFYNVDAVGGEWVMVSKTEVAKSGEESETIFNKNFSTWSTLDVNYLAQDQTYPTTGMISHEEEKLDFVQVHREGCSSSEMDLKEPG